MYVDIENRREAMRRGRLVIAYVTACDTTCPAMLDRWNSLLSTEEIARANRFRFIQDKISFSCAHSLARVMLSILLPQPPRNWRFTTDGLGRPLLCGGQIRYPVCFSLSHTRGLAACALGVGHGIGVDAEGCAAVRLLDLQGDWLTQDESAALHALPLAAKGEAAVQLWTLKEAVAKAMGVGLHQRFSDVGFALDPPRFARLPKALAGRWWLAQMRHTPAHMVAVAVRSATRRPVEITIEVLSADLIGAHLC
ncbi:4'-phosphopantetheinyl transferase family protein [Rhodopila sp.]|uniref:4'-phosphopantetheinyl transferase family protein n=1 Tax=Rhodopila sp. TaxID=2480087 RepID=UPI003D0F9C2B